MFRILLATQLIFLAVSGQQEVHRFIKIGDGAEIVQDIVHNKDENTVVITVSQTTALKNLVPTVNYHDFNTKFVAFKDIEHGACLLSYAPIPFATPGIYRLGKTSLTLPYTAKVKEQTMSNEEVEATAGSKIANFCSEYTTFWMDLLPIHGNTPVKRASDELEPCALGCGVCTVEIDRSYQTLASTRVLG